VSKGSEITCSSAVVWEADSIKSIKLNNK